MRRVLNNFAWLTLASVIGQAFGAAALIYASRRLGPATFGLLALAQAVANLSLTVSDMGLGRLGARMVASSTDESVATDIAVLRTGLNVACLIVMISGCFVLRLSRLESGLIVMSGVATTASALGPDFLWSGLQRMRTLSRVQILQQALRALGLSVGIAATGSALSVPISTAIAGIVAAFLLWRLLPAGFRKTSITPARWGKYLAIALPIGLAALLPDIYVNCDTILVRAILGVRVLGEYAAGYRLLLLSLTLGGLFVNAIFPELCRVAEDHRTVNGMLDAALSFALAVSVPVAAVVLIAPGEIIQLIFGSDYAKSASVTRILLLVPVLALPNLILSATLIAQNRARINLVAAAVGGVINLGLDGLLLPTIGLVGAGIATLAAEATVLAILLPAAHPRLDLRRNVKLLAATGVCATVFRVVLPVGFLPAVSVAAAAYVILLSTVLTTRELSRLVSISPLPATDKSESSNQTTWWGSPASTFRLLRLRTSSHRRISSKA